MITHIQTERAIVISDLHLGNPFCTSKRKLTQFISWAANNNYDIIINGDGFDIAQASFSKLAQDVPDVFHTLRQVAQNSGSNVYYVIGNHDIALENFLADWGAFKMAPFLNIQHKNLRVRVEHGHLYDPFFVSHPELYEFLTWFAGLFLHISPRLYKAWMWYEKTKAKILWSKAQSGEHPQFREFARSLLLRGFDVVVFGHTHHASAQELDGGQYINSGSWMMSCPCVVIENGKVVLREFDTKQSTLINKQDRKKAA